MADDKCNNLNPAARLHYQSTMYAHSQVYIRESNDTADSQGALPLLVAILSCSMSAA